MDGDGFGDFAVGAPFENDGKGVVRIYFGRFDIENIFHDVKENVIEPKNHRGFGMSFSKNHADIDQNGLEDLAVGSFMSDEAVILRRSPSVWTEMQLKPTISSMNVDSLENFSVEICVKLLTLNKIEAFLEATIHLDLDPRY